jgi:hypothetical protein
MARDAGSAPQLWPASSVGQKNKHLGGIVMRKTTAAVATLLAVGALTGTALAASAYTVKVSSPTNFSSATFKVKVTGTARSSSQVTAYVGNKACATTAKSEAAQPARRVINKTVSGNYTATKTAQAGSAGSHRLCAYLTSTNGSTTRARSSSTYTVLTGGY